MNQHDPALLASRLPYQYGYVTNDVQRAVSHFGHYLEYMQISPERHAALRAMIPAN